MHYLTLCLCSDLQGVSLYEIKDALRTACEGEAHEELRAEVGRLKAQLECFESGASGNKDTKATNGVKTQEEFDAEAASRAQINLELRVGELEELEGELRKELATVYETAQRLTAKNTAVETQIVQQQNIIDEYERKFKERDEDDIRKGSIVGAQSGSIGSYNYAEFAVGSNLSAQPALQLHNEPQSIHDMKQRVLEVETTLEGEKQHNLLLKQQNDSAQKSYELKLEQNQHRIQFLEGQIMDLEQQLSSLYEAFNILQQERVEERDQKL